MAQYNSSQGDNQLKIPSKYINELDIRGFSLMLKDPSYCYKFYWLEAFVKLVSEGKLFLTFDEIINEMITNAWYSVREFHIHLSGKQNGQIHDGLELIIELLAELSNLSSNSSQEEILTAIKVYDSSLRKYKVQLTHMVPYRALSGFFNGMTETIQWGNVYKQTEYISRINKSVVELPYTLGTGATLKKEVYVSKNWAEMIKENTVTILGWIQHEKVKWLQTNNPEVPALVFKLAQMDTGIRRLKAVHKLWDGILECTPIYNVFSDDLITKKYDVDHFIPWSFLMNDELWNLMPIDPSINSSKNDRLPDWQTFFEKYAGNQYVMYQMIHGKPGIKELYASCFRDNLHSLWASQELYIPGNSKETFFTVLEKNMHPIYDSAYRQGYDIWNHNNGIK